MFNKLNFITLFSFHKLSILFSDFGNISSTSHPFIPLSHFFFRFTCGLWNYSSNFSITYSLCLTLSHTSKSHFRICFSFCAPSPLTSCAHKKGYVASLFNLLFKIFKSLRNFWKHLERCAILDTGKFFKFQSMWDCVHFPLKQRDLFSDVFVNQW